MGLPKYTQGMHTKENPAEEKASKKKNNKFKYIYTFVSVHI